MDAAQLHVGSPLSLSQWLADWPLQRKRHESELVEPKRVSLRVPFAETESRPRELGPARMARRYGGSNLQGQVGHQRPFRPRRASHGSPCRWLGRRDAISCPAVAVRQRATDARSVGSIVRARYIQEFALRLMSPAVAVRQRATDARSVGSIVGARYIQEFALRLMSPAVAVRQRATDARSVGSIVRARYIQEFALRLMSPAVAVRQRATDARSVGSIVGARYIQEFALRLMSPAVLDPRGYNGGYPRASMIASQRIVARLTRLAVPVESVSESPASYGFDDDDEHEHRFAEHEEW